jgi:hypothetical protein
MTIPWLILVHHLFDLCLHGTTCICGKCNLLVHLRDPTCPRCRPSSWRGTTASILQPCDYGNDSGDEHQREGPNTSHSLPRFMTGRAEASTEVDVDEALPRYDAAGSVWGVCPISRSMKIYLYVNITNSLVKQTCEPVKIASQSKQNM